MFADNINSDKIYSVYDCDCIFEDYEQINKYLNVSASFDIETSSFYEADLIKTGLMYEWTFGLNGHIVIGRTWDEFIILCGKIYSHLHTTTEKKNERILPIYVHNLAFEFQFIMRYFDWMKVFALEERKPVTALTETGLEFRCSYILSGKSLALLGDGLQTYKFEKMVGDLDYSLIRHSKTPLTEAELKYCVNDVKVVMAYIQEKFDAGEDVTKIPKTKTSYVRNYCRDLCLYKDNIEGKRTKGKWTKYHKMMKCMSLDADTYRMLKRAFQGGFTHGNAHHIDQTLYDICSYDFTSSYPAVMVSEQFPMSRFKKIDHITKEEFENSIKNFCCLFDVEFYDIMSTSDADHPISTSKCFTFDNMKVDNGRLISADRITTTITEQDFLVYRKFYKWSTFKIINFHRAIKGYLPHDFVKAILNLYQKKTTLKGVKGAEEEYQLSKEMLNSCYGMTVTDIVKPVSTFENGEWTTSDANMEKEIEKYNNSPRRFLYYAWGVWITAYARRNLFTAIYEFGLDYVYSDTDSVKGLHHEEHQNYIQHYNDRIIHKLEKAMEYHHFNKELIRPKTVEGVEKPLGVWDYEGQYDRFKTLGAKRYMTEKNGKMSLTVSGLNKYVTMPYMIKEYGDPFPFFEDNMYIPKGATGKLIHTYIDEVRTGIVTDYLGTDYAYKEMSGVHLEEADYTLSIPYWFMKYILGLRQKEGIK